MECFKREDHLNLCVDQAFWPEAAYEFAEVPRHARIKPQILAMRARRRGSSARQTDLSNLIRSVWVQIKVTPITVTLAIVGARQGWRVPSGLRPATSVNWRVMVRAWRMPRAPILIGFSLKLVSDQSAMAWGNSTQRRAHARDRDPDPT